MSIHAELEQEEQRNQKNAVFGGYEFKGWMPDGLFVKSESNIESF
jgi:hypothetical protein